MIRAGIIGATGLVGRTLRDILVGKGWRNDRLFLTARPETVLREHNTLINLRTMLNLAPEFVFMAAGSEVSAEWTRRFLRAGSTVIDKSSLYRMKDDVPLIVPEVNGDLLNGTETLIATPNCSTTQLVMVLAPLHEAYGLKRVVVSTYQSVSGSGMRGVQQLTNERAGVDRTRYYPHRIDRNVIPHCDAFSDNGYTKEELKLQRETTKIFRRMINLTATTVRVPVEVGHSESVNVEFEEDFDMPRVLGLLGNMPGVVVLDDPKSDLYPMPIMVEGRDEVFVGRIRRDHSQPNTLNLWIVGDNLRKGAALNAIQIMELLIKIRTQE